MVGLIMFFFTLGFLALGFPVAFTFAGSAVLFGVIAEGFAGALKLFEQMPYRIMSIMENTIFMAIPLFILMGIILQKTKMAERLLESIGSLFGNVRGGVGIATILIGAILAATTGVVGASVIAMGVIALPVMLKNKYNPNLSTGIICASGTLGQIIPPSIVLIILGDVLNISVGDLFKAAVFPSLVLVSGYIFYTLFISFMYKDVAPASSEEIRKNTSFLNLIKAMIPPLVLMILVLGSIFAGIATPTESASFGAMGAIFLSILYKEFSFKLLKESAEETVKITSMVFAILIGATAFSLVFTNTGGDYIVEELMTSLPGEKWGFLILSMLIIIVLGFFIDFVEIAFIIVPILFPIAVSLNIDLEFFAILIAVNLQTSFLTPPFGFSLFYLKGVCPPEIKTSHIYRGVVPFIIIQIIVLFSILFFPNFYGLKF